MVLGDGRGVKWHTVDSRPGDVRHTRADITKAQRLLGYRPEVRFEEGLLWTTEALRQAVTEGVAAR